MNTGNQTYTAYEGAMAEEILRVEALSKSFPGVKALDNIQFSLNKGEVHVLLGENGAGKSTLIKILSGAFKKDAGEITIDGKPVEISSVQHAQRLGVTTIYQEMNLIPGLTVAQNIHLAREPKKKGGLPWTVDTKAMNDASSKLLASLGMGINPEITVNQLSVPQQQLVEVAKALSLDAKIIIFDEPTATLADRETEALFKLIRLLKERGLGIIYISHRMEEVWQIGDRITVLRDGCYIGTKKAEDVTISEVVKMMVGRVVDKRYQRTYMAENTPVLELKNVCRGEVLRNINIVVNRGEIVGLSGLVGAGRTELAEAIFGVEPITSGSIIFNGKEIEISSPEKASRIGLAFVTEDRKGLGLFQRLSVRENIIHAAMRQLFPNGIINSDKEQKVAAEFIDKLSIKTPSQKQLVKQLSGGNQQKVVLAKWLATHAKLFIMDEPTRGVDVGAKQEIYLLMEAILKEGCPILMISSELPEILAMSDRIYVMHEGRITAEYDKDSVTQEKILTSAMGR
jgi:ribose transport system ATP-binding protein